MIRNKILKNDHLEYSFIRKVKQKIRKIFEIINNKKKHSSIVSVFDCPLSECFKFLRLVQEKTNNSTYLAVLVVSHKKCA